jgi:putative endonuclease
MDGKRVNGTRRSVWWVYLLRCKDGSLYAGATTDVRRRLRQHTAGTASRYTRSRRPVALVYRERAGSCSAALRREAAIKRLTRAAKEKLIAGL